MSVNEFVSLCNSNGRRFVFYAVSVIVLTFTQREWCSLDYESGLLYTRIMIQHGLREMSVLKGKMSENTLD